MSHIFLYGPPGSGKSTLGSALAISLQMPFVDLDQAIQLKTGLSIPELMERSGEGGFRNLEAGVLKEQLSGQEAVIALGGGTLLRRENRALAEHTGKIVCLRADSRVLLQRLEADPSPRPLLAGNMTEKLLSLLAARAPHYDSFRMQFNSDRPVEKLTEQLQARIGRFHLSAMDSYDVVMEEGGLDRLGEMLRVGGETHPIVVTDENVCQLYSERIVSSLERAGYHARMLTIPAGESSKTIDHVMRLWRGFLEAELDRKSTVIALGGGVVGDLAGFAASTFMRGIDWLYVPTTLLAMVDASIGGKTGIDLPEGKNLVGAFNAPRLVFIDPQFLNTLPEVEFRCGLAEVVKHGVIADRQLFDLCALGSVRVKDDLPEIIGKAVAVKVRIVEADPYERNTRAALNFGHTLGHAVELVSEFRVRHGEAVAIGMVAEARLAERLGIARAGLSEQLAAALSGLGLPVCIPQDLPRPALIRAMYHDKKKSGGVVRFALPADIGQVQVNVEVDDLQAVFEERSA